MDKLWPTPKHGSINLYVHGNQKARQDGQPGTSTSTLTQLLNYDSEESVQSANVSAGTTKTLWCSFALSRLDYCNCLVADSPKYILRKFRGGGGGGGGEIAAGVVFRSSTHQHVSSLLHTLQWLPICQRINYKLLTICFSSVTESGWGPCWHSRFMFLPNSFVPPLTLVCFQFLLSKQSSGPRSLVY